MELGGARYIAQWIETFSHERTCVRERYAAALSAHASLVIRWMECRFGLDPYRISFQFPRRFVLGDIYIYIYIFSCVLVTPCVGAYFLKGFGKPAGVGSRLFLLRIGSV